MALRLAIVGATGHIGRSLLWNLGRDKSFQIQAYARRVDAVHEDLAAMEKTSAEAIHMDKFGTLPFDIVVNCVGAGDPARVRDMGAEIFRVTEDIDNRILDCLSSWPAALYINMSSGAVYGTPLSQPLTFQSVCSRRVNELNAAEWYGIAKRNAEAKHRAHEEFNIVDVRVFSYFSRFLNREGRLFIVYLVNALIGKRMLQTTSSDSVRDYATPSDLLQLLSCIIERWQAGQGKINDALDLYTKAPVGKFELIEAVAERFDLSWEATDDLNTISSTGEKQEYFSRNLKAADWGYEPKLIALDGILDELFGLLKTGR